MSDPIRAGVENNGKFGFEKASLPNRSEQGSTEEQSQHVCERSARMFALVESFPTLRNHLNTGEWDYSQVAGWLKEPWPGRGGRASIAFVLAVWSGRDSGYYEFENPDGMMEEAQWRFSAIDAMSIWDNSHRDAFRAWVANPWWV